MPLQTRLLRATFKMPNGTTMVLDETLDLNIGIHKDCLHMQSTAEIEVYNLTTTVRESLLSQFTEWNARLVQTAFGDNTNNMYVSVTIEAGYVGGNASKSILFVGQVVSTQLTNVPPNIGLRFTCASRQIDKTKDSAVPPPSATFKEYVQWASEQMGVSSFICQTSHDNDRVDRAFISISDVSALIWEIQAMFRPHVVAYIDNDILYVRDINTPLAEEAIINITEFIGVPSLTSFGATFTTLLLTSVHLAGLVNLQSKMNPALANGKPFLVFKLDYRLTSRQTDFYLTAEVYPEAG